MTGEPLRDIAACVFGLVIGGVLLAFARIARWAVTDRRRHGESHCE
jgi:hypothetical protein